MLSSILQAVWFLQLALQGLLVAVLLAKGIWKKFSIFTTYAVLNFLSGVTYYLVFGVFKSAVPLSASYYIYWIPQWVTLFLGIWTVYEIFGHLFVPYPTLRRLAAAIFQWAMVALVVLGVVVRFSQSSLAGRNALTSYIVAEEAMRVVEVGLLMVLFLFATTFGLHWRQYVFGIALGLGIFTTVQLAALTLRVHFGLPAGNGMQMADVLSFSASLMVWIGYLFAPERAAARQQVPQRVQLEQWNQALTEIIYQ